MSRRASDFAHVRDLARKQIELGVAVAALNQQERAKYDELMSNYSDWAAIHALHNEEGMTMPTPSPAPAKQRKPRQRKPAPPEVTDAVR